MSDQPMLIDPLTGTYTRASLHQRLNEEIERAQRYNSPFSLLLLDLDHFKSVNDAFGHARGDAVLVELVQRIRSVVRSADILFRFGGDEFVLLLPNTGKTQALSLAQRLLDSIRSTPFEGEPPLSISMSIGVANCPEDGLTPETLFDKTDLRQYLAKRAGRGLVVGDSGEEQDDLSLETVSRLVDRDSQLRAMNSFFRQLAGQKRGELIITGVDGSGRSAFLGEASKAARLQGYEVVSLSGRPGIANRMHGALSVGFDEWELPSLLAGSEEVGRAIDHVIADRGRLGLLVAIENLAEIDWASLEMIKQLFVSGPLERMAVAATLHTGQNPEAFLPGSDLCETLEMIHLSPEGLHIWLRSVLHWELPDDVLNWLYRETGGLPGNVARSLKYLVERGVFRRANQAWEVIPEYSQMGLKAWLHTPPHAPHNLPIPPTNFVGRAKEIQAAKDILSHNRLVSICGPGGIGKTRLGLQVAWELAEDFEHGAYFIPLASLSSPDFLVSAIASTLNFNFYSSEDPLIQLINFLREKETLLLMDNFEHLVEGAGVVGEIIANARQVKVLVTSRERLNLRGETVMELKGMNFPPDTPLQQMEMYSAVQFFLASARQASPGFKLTGEDRPSLVRICQMLEGLPLGIELAAAWVRILTVEEIAREIEQNLDFLVTTKRDVPERHRSLRAVFDHSWNLLNEAEQKCFSRLSVFWGGFRKDAAAQAATASLPMLLALADKSLIRQASPGRYSMHDALKQYAAERLAQSPEDRHATQRMHAAYYADFMDKRADLLRGEKQKEAVEEIASEIDNLRAAWNFATGELDTAWIEKALVPVFLYYVMRGMLQEGRDMFQTALERLEQAPATANPTHMELLKGLVTVRLASFYARVSQLLKAKELYSRALPIILRLGEPKDLAYLYSGIATLAERMADFSRAEEYCAKSMAVYEQMGDQHGLAQIRNEFGVVAFLKGDYDIARQFHQEAVTLFRSIPDVWGVSRSLINLGNVESETGNYQIAQEQYTECLEICRSLGDKVGMAVVLNNLGDIAREQQDHEAARRLLTESIEICREIGDLLGLGIAINNLGEIAFRQGNYTKAEELYEQGLQVNSAIANRLNIAYSLYHLGRLAAARDSLQQAWDSLKQALQIAMDTDSPPFALEILTVIAELYAKQDRPDFAAQLAALVAAHPSTPIEARENARRMLPALAEKLRAELYQAAREAGERSAQIPAVYQTVIDQILAQQGDFNAS